MLPIRPTSQFKKDLKKAIKQGRKTNVLAYVLECLSKMEPLPFQYQDHKLKGNWRDFRECHIEPDWLQGYSILKKLDKNSTTNCIVHYKFINMYVLLFRPLEN